MQSWQRKRQWWSRLYLTAQIPFGNLLISWSWILAKQPLASSLLQTPPSCYSRLLLYSTSTVPVFKTKTNKRKTKQKINPKRHDIIDIGSQIIWLMPSSSLVSWDNFFLSFQPSHFMVFAGYLFVHWNVFLLNNLIRLLKNCSYVLKWGKKET